MKSIFTIALLLSAIFGRGQFPGQYQPVPILKDINLSRHCGTWEKQPEIISDWVTVDTLGNKKLVRCFCALDSLRRWVYDEERNTPPTYWMIDDYYPCGRPHSDEYEQYRICSITGIRQRRTRTIPYKYVEPPKSEYQRVEDSLNAAWRKAHRIDTLRFLSGDVVGYGSDTVTWKRFYAVGSVIKLAAAGDRTVDAHKTERPYKITCSCPCHDGKAGFFHCFTDCCKWPNAPRISPKKSRK